MTKTENLDLDPFASNIPDFTSNISDEDCKEEFELALQQLDEAFENLDPVLKATNGKQRPETSDSMIGEFAFKKE